MPGTSTETTEATDTTAAAIAAGGIEADAVSVLSLPEPPTADRWTTEAWVQLYVGEPYPATDQIDNAIGWATVTFQMHQSCTVEVDGEPELPVDLRFQQAIAIMAAGVLTGETADVGGGGEVVSESIGGYRYQLAAAAKIHDALDPRTNTQVMALVGWCIKSEVAGGAYEIRTPPAWVADQDEDADV